MVHINLKLAHVPYEQTKGLTENILENKLMKKCKEETIYDVDALSACKNGFFVAAFLPIIIGFPIYDNTPAIVPVNLLWALLAILVITVCSLIVIFGKRRNYMFFLLLGNVFEAVDGFILLMSLFNFFITTTDNSFINEKILYVLYFCITLIAFGIVFWFYRSFDQKLKNNDLKSFSFLQKIEDLMTQIAIYSGLIFFAVYSLKKFKELFGHHPRIDQFFDNVEMYLLVPVALIGGIIFLEFVYYPFHSFLPAYYLLKYRKEYEQEYDFSYQGLPESN